MDEQKDLSDTPRVSKIAESVNIKLKPSEEVVITINDEVVWKFAAPDFGSIGVYFNRSRK